MGDLLDKVFDSNLYFSVSLTPSTSLSPISNRWDGGTAHV